MGAGSVFDYQSTPSKSVHSEQLFHRKAGEQNNGYKSYKMTNGKPNAAALAKHLNEIDECMT